MRLGRLAAILACLLVALPVFAQRDRASIQSATAGLGGVLGAERWTPITVVINAGDKPEQFTLTAEYRQDTSQFVLVRTPVATTPGQSVTVPLLVCPPVFCERITVTLWNGVLKQDSVEFSNRPSDRQLPINQPGTGGGPVIGMVDLRIAPETLKGWHRPEQAQGYESVVPVQFGSGELSTSWAGYDGLSVLVVRLTTLEKAATGVLDGVEAWVRGGGRLVLIADGPGSAWKRFVPSGGGVTLSDPLEISAPTALAGLVSVAGGEVARQIKGRAALITSEGMREGWQGEGIVSDADGTARVMTAYGPCDCGLVAIAGYDPALVSATLSDSAVEGVWQNLLDHVMPEYGPAMKNPMLSYGYGASSGDGPLGSAALQTAVDDLCNVPAIPRYVYIVLIVMSAALALAVSIGDFVWLGWRKWRHRSWITALVWIGLTAALAWWLPNAIRRSDSQLSRLEVVDQVVEAGGASRAWRSGLTTIFASRSTTTAVLRSDGKPLDGYWRGASPAMAYAWNRQSRKLSTPTLILDQRISALQGSAAAMLPGSKMGLGQWTLRTITDKGPATPLRVLRRDGTEGDEFVLPGVRPEQFESASLQSRDGWFAVHKGADEGSSLVLAVSRTREPAENPWHFGGFRQPIDPYGYQPHRLARGQPSTYFQLDDARRRTPALGALTRAGGYAVLHLRLKVPCQVALEIQTVGAGHALYRIAMPTPPAATPSTP